jgi:hypothetical protein
LNIVSIRQFCDAVFVIYQGDWVYKDRGGVFEGNDLRENVKGPPEIAKDCELKVTRKGNQE